MIEINEDVNNGNLALRVAGEISREELAELAELIRKQAQYLKDPHLLVIIEGFEGWAAFNVLRMSRRLYAKYANCFDRIAVVHSHKNQKQTRQYFGTLMKGELMIFSIDEAENAWSWIDQKPHL
ncbi:STAS/SEC14 domain-containing protein [Fodinibius saliphilus]|uniref:STAS/SEC14 domain-containing protein n=1 Tax=Fodinibius saliphilus TaxID=1920650 RepID=UPI001107D6E6|nr:STAS/SEC14 domain-containing protein [Fodinibius saliphilus]